MFSNGIETIMGVSRNIDGTGRVQIPKNIRREHKILPGDPLEVLTFGSVIIIKKNKKPSKDVELCEECGKPVHLNDAHCVIENGDIIHNNHECIVPYLLDYMDENQLWSLQGRMK